MNPLMHRSILGAASAISCLGLVYSAYSQSGLGQTRAAHDAAGQKTARGIVPLAADGNPDPVNGKIVIMPVSVSNGYGAWHLGDAGDTSTTFMTRANANPAKNPKLFIAYGFEYQLPGGNGGTGDPGPNSIFYRTLDHALQQQGVTPRQALARAPWPWPFPPTPGTGRSGPISRVLFHRGPRTAAPHPALGSTGSRWQRSGR